MEWTKEKLDLINTEYALMSLLRSKGDLNFPRAMAYAQYEYRIKELQEELIKLQQWNTQEQKRIIILFEGRDAAGKGGAIRRITQYLNPREYRNIALPKPDEVEKTQWYFQRYINQFPKAGEIVFFDRSWYNRAVVEPVNDFCTNAEYKTFMKQVNELEKMIVDSGIILLKIYFSISKEEQAKRFEFIKKSSVKKWKFSKVDENALNLWDKYSEFKQVMLKKTNTPHAPWKIIRADKKTSARIEALEYILHQIHYKGKNHYKIKPKKLL